MEVQVHLEPHVPPRVYPSLHSALEPSRGSSFSWDTRHPEALVCMHAHVCVCVLMPLEPPFKPKGDGSFPDTSGRHAICSGGSRSLELPMLTGVPMTVPPYIGFLFPCGLLSLLTLSHFLRLLPDKPLGPKSFPQVLLSRKHKTVTHLAMILLG